VSASRLARAIKRAVDVAGATAGLVVAAPVIGAVALGIRATMGRPILYRQARPGRDEKPIRVWKFRTMSNARGADGQLLPDAERLTAFGRRLRELSLDELPQLFNVLSGEMSLIGPRPLLTRYLPRYDARQRRRHLVKPGITGWAQVHGRNALDWDTRLELDAWYAEHWSLLVDLRILARTVLALARRRDVKAGAGAELDEFWGREGPPPTGPRAFPAEELEPGTPEPEG
jgi:lipopolysaccharide/colanic/teichoic acid biosynthesis glycosyltransferase